MCIVCILLDKEKITKQEAKRALFEQGLVSKTKDEIDHLQEIYLDLDKELNDSGIKTV